MRTAKERAWDQGAEWAYGQASAQIAELEAENARLRETLLDLDRRVWRDQPLIKRADEWRDLIRTALTPTPTDTDA